MASEYTQNRRYPLYTDSDKPNLRDQYNGAIREIDADMAQALQDSSGVAAALGSGFDAQHTVRMAIDSTDNAVSAEATARQNADTSLGTRIDSEATARQNADSALGTRIDNEVTARQNADTTLGNRISALENPTKYIATIGDSFGNENGEWAALTANKTGYQLINRCTNEAGFVYNGTDGKSFIGQLQDIKNNAHFANVEYIIVYGGVNDFTMQITAAAMKASINSFMNEYNSISGKKPKLIFAFGNFGNGRLRTRSSQFPAWYNEIVNYCRTIGIPVVDYVPLWLACSDVAVFNSDNLHPNSVGENIISSYVQSLINGSYNGVHKSYVGTYDGPVYTINDSEIAGATVKYNEHLYLDNGIITHVIGNVNTHVNALDTSKFSGNTWYALRSAFYSATYWQCFGDVNAQPTPLLATMDPYSGQTSIAVQTNAQTGTQSNIGMIEYAHNFGNQNNYFKIFGSMTALSIFSSWDAPQPVKFSYNIL